MAEESNGESTFEFVEKKTDEMSISGETTKTDSSSSISSSASLLPPLGISSSSGNLLSNVSPPSALPSFVSSSVKLMPDSSGASTGGNNDSINKQPQSQSGVTVKQPHQETYYSASFSPAIPSNESTEIPQATQNQDFNLFSWVKENVAASKVVKKVTETAKSSVNYMLTTLDPQMQQFMYPYEEIEVVVASDKDIKIGPIQDAFEAVFGQVKVSGVASECSKVAVQPVGFAAGIRGAEERINTARSNPSVGSDVPVVAIENFILEVSQGQWYDLGVIVLSDPKNNVNLQTFTQMTPVPSHIVASAQEATPPDYPFRSSGLAVTIGSLIADNLQVSHNEWHHSLTGVSRRDIIQLAAQSLVGIYVKAVPRTEKPSSGLLQSLPGHPAFI
ncbi:protein PRRC1-like [Diprion similis]|uniref:protein PRRC1-like n=1 Tax=Diprion similis TaxID=362088 RepID=UPI001EF831AE|nr:protein PRRC1-like [Diprion similis]